MRITFLRVSPSFSLPSPQPGRSDNSVLHASPLISCSFLLGMIIGTLVLIPGVGFSVSTFDGFEEMVSFASTCDASTISYIVSVDLFVELLAFVIFFWGLIRGALSNK